MRGGPRPGRERRDQHPGRRTGGQTNACGAGVRRDPGPATGREAGTRRERGVSRADRNPRLQAGRTSTARDCSGGPAPVRLQQGHLAAIPDRPRSRLTPARRPRPAAVPAPRRRRRRHARAQVQQHRACAKPARGGVQRGGPHAVVGGDPDHVHGGRRRARAASPRRPRSARLGALEPRVRGGVRALVEHRLDRRDVQVRVERRARRAGAAVRRPGVDEVRVPEKCAPGSTWWSRVATTWSYGAAARSARRDRRGHRAPRRPRPASRPRRSRSARPRRSARACVRSPRRRSGWRVRRGRA